MIFFRVEFQMALRKPDADWRDYHHPKEKRRMTYVAVFIVSLQANKCIFTFFFFSPAQCSSDRDCESQQIIYAPPVFRFCCFLLYGTYSILSKPHHFIFMPVISTFFFTLTGQYLGFRLIVEEQRSAKHPVFSEVKLLRSEKGVLLKIGKIKATGIEAKIVKADL